MLKFRQTRPDRPLANEKMGVIIDFMSRWLKRGVWAVFALLALFFVGANAWIWSAGWGRLAWRCNVWRPAWDDGLMIPDPSPDLLARAAHGLNPGAGRIRLALVAESAECLEAAQRIVAYIESFSSSSSLSS